MASGGNTLENPANSTYGRRGQYLVDRTESAMPKFKSISPPSLLPLSPLSPSAYFTIPAGLSPAGLLDSPVLFNFDYNILPSPTTGAFSAARGNNNYKPNIKQEDDKNLPGFSFNFQSSTSTSRTSTLQHQAWSFEESTKREHVSPEMTIRHTKNQSNGAGLQSGNKPSDDGFNWRKYGQKQVKGSENPRSYYKCTYPNCPVRKQVERAPSDGRITEIVYKGKHNHPKPESTKKPLAFPQAQPCYPGINVISELSFASHHLNAQTDSIATPENSSITMGDDDLDQISQRSKSGVDEVELEPDAKRRKSESENENENQRISAAGNRTVRDQRVVVQTISNIDKLDDGYWWRKYGQKVVKGNPNPRSYYKCTYAGCPVRKHIERACNDPRAVITTYEGKHSHNIPTARGSSSSSSKPLHSNSNTTAPTVIKPSPMTSLSHPNNRAATNDDLGFTTRPPTSDGQAPFTVDVLQSPSSTFEVSDFGNFMSMGSNQSMTLRKFFSMTKDESDHHDDSDSFMSLLL